MEQQLYMDIVHILLELPQLNQRDVTLLFLVVTDHKEKHQLQEFAVAQQDQIKFVVLQPQQQLEHGVIIVVHIMVKFVNMVVQDILHAIAEHVLDQNHLQIQDHVHVQLHLPLHAIAEHVQDQRLLQTLDHVLAHKQQYIILLVITEHAREHIVIKLQEAAHVQLIMQEK